MRASTGRRGRKNFFRSALGFLLIEIPEAALNNKSLLQRSFEIGFHPFIRSHLEYGMPACSPNPVAGINHLDRIKRLASRLVSGMRNFPNEERLQRLSLHSLERRRLRADLITAIKIKIRTCSSFLPLDEV